MYQRKITKREEGQRLDKYLHKLLPEAGSSFLYKMLRKKNIVLNEKKADGSEKIMDGDTISIYFSDETLQKFMGKTAENTEKNTVENTVENPYEAAYRKYQYIPVIYENEHILIADKPTGVLTQKAAPQDISLNEWLIGYLLKQKTLSLEELTTFKPSVCNRLDRNTSGLVLCAKSIQGAQMLGEALKSRSLHKYYRLYVKGNVTEEKTIEGYLSKDSKSNKVKIAESGESFIQTRYYPISHQKDKTLLEVELITGKSHQIRAHLASIGHPLLGDYKYGDKNWNDNYKKQYHIDHQILHAYRVVFPKLGGSFADISEKSFEAPMPEIFLQIDK